MTPVVRIGTHAVNFAARRVRGEDGADVRLTPIEWQLLERLARHPGQLLTQRQLLTDIWGPGYARETGYLRFHLGQLRRKLESNSARPRHLITEAGIGYRFET